MSKHIFWVLTGKINNGQLEPLKTLIAEMVAATKADEPGALNYDWFISEDEKHCHIYECYADSDAAMIHLGNFNTKFAKRAWTCLSPTGMTVYGNPSEALRSALTSGGARFMVPVGGFRR